MKLPDIAQWFGVAPIWVVAVIILVAVFAAGMVGIALRAFALRTGIIQQEGGGGENHISSSILGLLALLMGFTFSLAIDRFDTRRVRVLEEANAIGTTYLRTQLLPEPHRERISGLLVDYVDNRLILAKARPGQVAAQLKINDRLVTDLWVATAAAFDDIKGLDFSSAYLDSMNQVIDLDAARKTARLAHVPAAVFAVLFIYLIVTAAMLGCVQSTTRGRIAVGFLMLLFTLALSLIIDIDRASTGFVRESQWPMEALRDSFRDQPPAVFDRYRHAP